MSKENAPGQNKTYEIIVNAQQKTFDKKKISYVEVITLAFGTYQDHPQIFYTVEYMKGENSNEGELLKGEEVTVKNGMIFDVTKTDKS